jgi:hypothetical protein
MKTFLEICKDVRAETGISGSGPVSVTTATGIEQRLVKWVRQAWLDVQQFRPDWPWMLQDFTVDISPGKNRYTPAELNLTDLKAWELKQSKIFKIADGKRGERLLATKNYFRTWPALSLGVSPDGPPSIILFDPTTNALVFYPQPDAEYTVTTRYYRKPQRLVADTDIPLLPPGEEYEKIIFWKALVYYGFYDGAPDILAEAEMYYGELITALDNQYGQIISFEYEPLA